MKVLVTPSSTIDLVRRVFPLFCQSVGGVLLSSLLLVHSSQDAKMVVGAALAAGLAAVKALLVSKSLTNKQ